MSTESKGDFLAPISLVVSPDEPVVVSMDLPSEAVLPAPSMPNHGGAGQATLPSVETQSTSVAFGSVTAASAGPETHGFCSTDGVASIPNTGFEVREDTGDEADEQDDSYSAWVKENVLESKWTTPFVTFYTHWLALILLAILVVHGPDRKGQVTITASTTTPKEMEFEPVEVIDTTVEQPQEETTAESEATVEVPMEMAVSEPVLPKSLVAADTAATEGKADANDAENNEAPAQAATWTPGHAVTKGSFSVWTVPENPDPGEAYKVVIQAKVPDHLKVYPVTDLEGVVVGSDGYRKLIPGSMRGTLPVNRGYIQFEVPIVAADAEIKDIVLIRSKMLKEQQKLSLEFY